MPSCAPAPCGDRPGELELTDIGLIDLPQRREALRVVGAVVHQPVVGAGVLEVVLSEGHKVAAGLLRNAVNGEEHDERGGGGGNKVVFHASSKL